MEFECAVGKIRYTLSVADRYLTKRINEEHLPILASHIPLFYILPEDRSVMIFNEISKRWQISKSSLSEIINKYQVLGILSKRECPQDKRSIYVALTEEGLEIRASLKRFEAEFLDLMLSGLSEASRAEFEQDLDHVVRNAIEYQKM